VTAQMQAAVLYGGHDLRLEQRPVPQPGPGEVLLRVAACAVCGSDLHAYHGSHPRIRFPRILGHEFAGTVAAVGSGVSSVAPGARVCAEVDLPCGACSQCHAGRTHLCLRLRTLGFDADGAYAEYVAVPAGNLHPLPPTLSFAAAALVQPLAVAYHGVKHQAGVATGQKVAVLGTGPIGLGAAAVARALGAWVVISSTRDARLEVAQRLGVDETVNVRREDLVARVLELTHGEGVDTVIEAVGGLQDETLQQATQIVRRAGLIVVLGTFPSKRATLRIAEFKDRELAMRGSRGDHQAFGPVIDLLASGAVDPSLFITTTLPLDQAGPGLQMLDEKRAGLVKVILQPVVTG